MKAKAVVKAAEQEPNTFAPWGERMDASGKVDRAFKAMKQIKAADERAEKAAEITLDAARRDPEGTRAEGGQRRQSVHR